MPMRQRFWPPLAGRRSTRSRCRPTSRRSGGRASQLRWRRSWHGSEASGQARRAVSPRSRAEPHAIAATGATLSGYADRIDLLAAGKADIIDYKTGSSPSKAQAHTLLAPQLALEGALLMQGAFQAIGAHEPADLAYVRLRANGDVDEESILTHRKATRSAADLSGTPGSGWKRWSATTRIQARAICRALCRSVKARPTATMITSPACSNGRRAAMANRARSNEDPVQRAPGDCVAAGHRRRSAQFRLGFRQCRVGQDACAVAARHPPAAAGHGPLEDPVPHLHARRGGEHGEARLRRPCRHGQCAPTPISPRTSRSWKASGPARKGCGGRGGCLPRRWRRRAA